MKALFLGNSHQNCVKTAAERSSSKAIEVRCVNVFPPRLGASLALEDGALAPTSSEVVIRTDIDLGDSNRIELDDYDVFVIAALGAGAPRPEGSSAVGNLVRHAEFASELGDGPQVVSETVFTAMLEAMIDDEEIISFASRIRNETKRPVFFLQWPLPCIEALDPKSSNFVKYYGARAEDALRWYGRATDRIARNAERNFGEGVRLLKTIPPEWSAEGLTPSDLGGVDPWHLNAAYGKMVLEGIQEAMRS